MSLIRYLAVDVLRGQRWMAPLLTFLVACTLLDAGGGPVLGDYGSTAAVLLPVTLWLTIVVNQNEDPIQNSITVVTAGGATRVRLAKLAVAFLGAAAMGAFAVLWPLLVKHEVDPGAGALAHLSTAVVGVGVGALLSRPVLRKTAWAVLIATAVTLGEILIPHCPPGRQILSRLGADHPHDVAATLLLITLESLALGGIAALCADRLARLHS
ncbi:MAG TPA: hypothetical protein VHC49_23765 [Mycobacteriales bacterium]|nr:hypothetical protein [Mycobacteriales bacterium]